MLSLSMVSFPILFFLEPERIWKCNMKKVKSESVSHSSWPALCDPMTVAQQTPLSMEFSRQEY